MWVTLYTAYLVILFVSAIPINGFALYSLIKDRRQLKRLWIVLINLPLSHLLQLLLALPLPMISGLRGHWIFGDFGINYYAVISGLTGFVTIYTHLLLAVERFYGMKRCFQGHFKLKYLIYMAIACWLLPAILVTLPLFGWSSYKLEPIGIHSGPNWSRDKNSLSYIAMLLTIGFVIPELLIVVFNLMFLKSAKNVKTLEPIFYRYLKKYVNVSILLFNLCWGPYAICGIMVLFFDADIPFELYSIAGGFAKLAIFTDTLYFIYLRANGFTTLKKCFKLSGQSFKLKENITSSTKVKQSNECNHSITVL